MGITKAISSCTYYLNPSCKEFKQGIYMPVAYTSYVCRLCHEQGSAVFETHWPSRYDTLEFNQVRLEFNYDPLEARYRGLFVLTDTSRTYPCNTWNICNPFFKTERMASKSATDILGYLQRATKAIFEPNIIHRNTDIILDFDAPLPVVAEDLRRLEYILKGSNG